MMVSLDRAGRVVIPKDVRDRLALDEDSELDVDVVGGAIHLTPRPGPRRRIVEVDGWPVIEAAADVQVTDADVRRWRDADQR